MCCISIYLTTFFIECLEGADDQLVWVVDSARHLGLEHLDHVVVVAGSAHLAQHHVQLVVQHQPTNVVEGSSRYSEFQ